MKLKEEAVREVRHRKNVRRGKNSKRKGSQYERNVAKLFSKVLGIELKRTPQSGGFAKKSEKADAFRGDITVVDKLHELLLHIECKDCKTWSLPAWIRQAEGDCPEGKMPAVVFHQYGTSKDYICLSIEDFLNLIEVNKVVSSKSKQ